MRIKTARRIMQIVPLFALPYLLVFKKEIIAIILFAALASSFFVGRAFCSWICPLGTVYEFFGLALKKKRPRYHCRIGCPFSLPIGMMNKVSLFRVVRNESTCKHCGTCYRNCPVGLIEIAGLNANHSLFYACIRCLNCVDSCPNEALTFKRTFRVLRGM